MLVAGPAVRGPGVPSGGERVGVLAQAGLQVHLRPRHPPPLLQLQALPLPQVIQCLRRLAEAGLSLENRHTLHAENVSEFPAEQPLVRRRSRVSHLHPRLVPGNTRVCRDTRVDAEAREVPAGCRVKPRQQLGLAWFRGRKDGERWREGAAVVPVHCTGNARP